MHFGVQPLACSGAFLELSQRLGTRRGLPRSLIPLGRRGGFLCPDGARGTFLHLHQATDLRIVDDLIPEPCPGQAAGDRYQRCEDRGGADQREHQTFSPRPS